MSQYDGSVKFDTKLDTTAMQNGLKNLKLLAIGAFTSIATAGTLAIKECTKVGMSFESTMSKVGAISGATADEMDALSKKAKEMGASTVFSASESAEALTYMAMAGWKTEDMLSGIEGIMNLAAAAGENLASVSDIVTDALTAFGLSASDGAHFADVLAVASSNSNTNVSMMGATFKYAAPLAGSLGYKVEDVATAIGLMANAGIKGEQAGTALRAMINRLSTGTGDAKEAMEALGISIQNSDGTIKPFSATVEDLRAKFANLSAAEQTMYASQIAGQEAMSALLAIVNASEADFNKLTKAVNSADGAAKQMAETMVDNLPGDLTLMNSALEGVEVAVYDCLDEPFRIAAKGATDALSEIERSLSGGKLKDKVEKLGNSLADFAEGFIDTATDALPMFIDALSLLVENLDILAALIVGIAQTKMLHTAMMAYQSLMKTSTARVAEYTAALAFEQSTESRGITVSKMVLAQMTLKDLAVGVLTGKITLATAAQNLWNAAMNSNPIGILITLLGIVIPLIGTGLKRALDDSNSSANKFNETMQEINDTYEKACESAEEHIKSAEVEATKVDMLTAKLFELNEELLNNTEDTEENRKKKAELLAVVEDLEELIPDLNIEIDEETGKIITEREEVDKLTEAYKKLMRIKADQVYYQETYNAAVATENSLKDQLQVAENELNEMYDPTNKGIDPLVWNLVTTAFGEKEAWKYYFLLENSEDYTAYNAYKQKEAEIEAIKEEIEKATAETERIYADYISASVALDELDGDNSTGSTGGTTGSGTDNDTSAEKELRDLKFAYKMGKKSAKEYYDALEAYRDKHFTVGSEEWQDYTLEIKEGREKLAEDTQKILEKQIEDEREALENQKRRGQISEKEYYDELTKLRDKYFEEGSEQWQEYTDEIIEYEKEIISETITNISKFIDESLGETQAKIDTMREKLASYGAVMYEDEAGNKRLENQGKKLDALYDYYGALYSIRDRMEKIGISSDTARDFLAVIADMSVEDGIAFADLLLKESDYNFEKFISQYARAQELAEAFSETFYSDEYEEKVDDVTEYMKAAFDELGVELPENFFNCGKDSAERYGQGFLSEIDTWLGQIEEKLTLFNSTLGILVSGGAALSDVISGNNSETTINNTYNIINPNGTVTEGLAAATLDAIVNRNRGFL